MIDKITYTKDWIDSISKQNRNTDKILVEKVIRALTLLTELEQSGLKFIFKGGTALMLMLNKPTRLSIDIDIIVEKDQPNLDTYFSNICKKGSFLHFTKQERVVTNNIEKAHYKFFYNPAYTTHSQEEFVILDILFESNPYISLVDTTIQSPFIKCSDEPLFVKTPNFEGILGDKLTAFAPNTTGIPYYKGTTSMSMEIVKQLYDIGNLFNVINHISEVRDTFNIIALNELKYRNLQHLAPADVLNDIIQTAFCICTRGLAGNGNFSDIQAGIKRMGSFIYSSRYVIEDAILSASKAAYIASLLKSESYTLLKFNPDTNIADLSITNPAWNKLNKLKQGLPEAFWYWSKTTQQL